jgi:CubicO group peptidase (beta-lactamase class C family)
MTPRQMIEFGELYENGGRVGDRQIVPRLWVDKADDGVGRSRWGSDREYGYGFWIRDFAGHKSYYAWGYGGQFIFVVPDLDLVVVTTSRSDVSTERRDHLGAIYDLVETQIVPAIKG